MRQEVGGYQSQYSTGGWSFNPYYLAGLVKKLKITKQILIIVFGATRAKLKFQSDSPLWLEMVEVGGM